MDFKVCVNSNINFYEKTLPIIIPSLIASGCKKESIFIFVGGFKEKKNRKYEGITLIETNHNSIDFTGLIEIVEQEISADYWFMTHDTCYVGKEFYQLVTKIPTDAKKIALKEHPSMNIGSYQYEYLLNNKDVLLKFKNEDLSAESVQKYKKEGVPNEDLLLFRERKLPTFIYPPSHCIKSDINLNYGSSVPRIIEYYSQLDFYKSKANWCAKQVYETNL